MPRSNLIAPPLEAQEQANLVQWFRLAYPKDLIIHVPNGAGKLSLRQGGALKKTGVVSGVPDLFIPAWKLWIEMKRKKGSYLSKEQKDMMDYLQSCGYRCIVAKGFEHARAQILDFKYH